LTNHTFKILKRQLNRNETIHLKKTVKIKEWREYYTLSLPTNLYLGRLKKHLNSGCIREVLKILFNFAKSRNTTTNNLNHMPPQTPK